MFELKISEPSLINHLTNLAITKNILTYETYQYVSSSWLYVFSLSQYAKLKTTSLQIILNIFVISDILKLLSQSCILFSIIAKYDLQNPSHSLLAYYKTVIMSYFQCCSLSKYISVMHILET